MQSVARLAPRRFRAFTRGLRAVVLAIVPVVAVTFGCAPTPPPLWATGGAPLELGRIVWVQVDGEQLRMDEQGRVFADGKHVFSVDRAGRVVDEVNDPVALLDGEGQLFATNETY